MKKHKITLRNCLVLSNNVKGTLFSVMCSQITITMKSIKLYPVSSTQIIESLISFKNLDSQNVSFLSTTLNGNPCMSAIHKINS